MTRATESKCPFINTFVIFREEPQSSNARKTAQIWGYLPSIKVGLRFHKTIIISKCCQCFLEFQWLLSCQNAQRFLHKYNPKFKLLLLVFWGQSPFLVLISFVAVQVWLRYLQFLESCFTFGFACWPILKCTTIAQWYKTAKFIRKLFAKEVTWPSVSCKKETNPF